MISPEYGHLDVEVLDNHTVPSNTDYGFVKGDPMDNLEKVAEQIEKCSDCSLSRGRINAVPGQGNLDANVMFIGEGPGAQEDRQGVPFVGAAGKMLDDLLASVGMRREDVFIANMVKCRPPELTRTLLHQRLLPAQNIRIDK